MKGSFYYLYMKAQFDINNIDQYDSIIMVESSINEAKNSAIGMSGMTGLDPRAYMNPSTMPKPETILHTSYPGIGDMMRYGQVVRNSLQMGPGWSAEVVDFGDAITIKMTYTNVKTSNSASQNFVILFNNIKGQCIAKANSQRWKTCNSPDQAANYIRSKASALIGKTSGIN